jgi:hypothetical protein
VSTNRGSRDGLSLVGDDHIDDPVGCVHADRNDVVGVHVAEPPTRDHRGPAHTDRHVPGRDDQIGAAGETALPAKQRPFTIAIRGTSPTTPPTA